MLRTDGDEARYGRLDRSLESEARLRTGGGRENGRCNGDRDEELGPKDTVQPPETSEGV